MAVYSLSQMQSLLRQAGWPEALITTVAAIGMAESSGNTCIVGTMANNEYSVGLWQININPALRRPWTKTQLCDPLFNAQVALQIYKQQGLRAWGAYTDGRYRKYVTQSQLVYSQQQNQNGSIPPTTIASNTPLDADYLGEATNLGPGLLLAGLAVITVYLVFK